MRYGTFKTFESRRATRYQIRGRFLSEFLIERHSTWWPFRQRTRRSRCSFTSVFEYSRLRPRTIFITWPPSPSLRSISLAPTTRLPPLLRLHSAASESTHSPEITCAATNLGPGSQATTPQYGSPESFLLVFLVHVASL